MNSCYISTVLYIRISFIDIIKLDYCYVKKEISGVHFIFMADHVMCTSRYLNSSSEEDEPFLWLSGMKVNPNETKKESIRRIRAEAHKSSIGVQTESFENELMYQISGIKQEIDDLSNKLESTMNKAVACGVRKYQREVQENALRKNPIMEEKKRLYMSTTNTYEVFLQPLDNTQITQQSQDLHVVGFKLNDGVPTFTIKKSTQVNVPVGDIDIGRRTIKSDLMKNDPEGLKSWISHYPNRGKYIKKRRLNELPINRRKPIARECNEKKI